MAWPNAETGPSLYEQHRVTLLHRSCMLYRPVCVLATDIMDIHLVYKHTRCKPCAMSNPATPVRCQKTPHVSICEMVNNLHRR